MAEDGTGHRLRSQPAAAGPERALRKELTALTDQLRGLTADEEHAHERTLARFDDTDEDEDEDEDDAVPPPPPPLSLTAPPLPPRPTVAASRVACPALARALCAYKAACVDSTEAIKPRGGAELKALVAAVAAAEDARVPYDPAAATAAHASTRKRPTAPRKPPGAKKPPPAPASASLAGALADDRWDVCQKWTFAHAAAPYPSAEEKADLARKAGWPPGRVNHWFSNMRKRKYLKLRDGSRATRSRRNFTTSSLGARNPTRRPRAPAPRQLRLNFRH